MSYYTQSLKIKEEIGDKHGVTYSHNDIGHNYNAQNMHNRAIIECQKALTLSKEIGSIDQQKYACTCLYEAYKSLGNGTKALEYHEQLTVLNDSIFNDKNTKKSDFQSYKTVASCFTFKKRKVCKTRSPVGDLPR